MTREELLTIDAEPLLRRLFWEEDLRRSEPLRPRFACRCSRERVRAMLHGLDEDDVNGITSNAARPRSPAKFCGLEYRVDAVDMGELFRPQRD
ncbi:MAG: Hsp33 family molecular chaperone HslO [Pseudomonadota bacterium]